MARLMFSCGMFSALAARIAVRRRGLPFRVAAAALGGDGDFPDQAGEYLAALGIQRAFLCLIVAHFEWPDMEPQR